MEAVYLALGSNLGNRWAHLEQARRRIAHLSGVNGLTISENYETDAVGPVAQGAFLNAAARFETTHDPQALLDQLRRIETELGRPEVAQRQRWGPRVIDLDILLFGQRVIDQPGLRVPHPRMHERWFVLRPLADLGPDLVHPVLGRTIGQLLDEVSGSDQNRLRIQ